MFGGRATSGKCIGGNARGSGLPDPRAFSPNREMYGGGAITPRGEMRGGRAIAAGGRARYLGGDRRGGRVQGTPPRLSCQPTPYPANQRPEAVMESTSVLGGRACYLGGDRRGGRVQGTPTRNPPGEGQSISYELIRSSESGLDCLICAIFARQRLPRTVGPYFLGVPSGPPGRGQRLASTRLSCQPTPYSC